MERDELCLARLECLPFSKVGSSRMLQETKEARGVGKEFSSKLQIIVKGETLFWIEACVHQWSG
jgi:hypothetical protein